MKIFFRRLIISQAILLSVTSVFALGTNPNNSSSTANGGPASQIILKGSLVSFNAASGRNFFTLSWNALPESSCDHFEVERSLDGVHYDKMGEVRGNAESLNEEAYSFKDNFHPVTARKYDFYYRLKQVDADGQISYSKVLIARMFNTRTLASLSVTPDPAMNDILVNAQLKEDSYLVMRITDMDGNLMIRKTKKVENGFRTFSLDGSSQLKPGKYMLEVIVNSNERLTMQLEKI
jgi:hypothetical protein